jgi:hypothetical protein
LRGDEARRKEEGGRKKKESESLDAAVARATFL